MNTSTPLTWREHFGIGPIPPPPPRFDSNLISQLRRKTYFRHVNLEDHLRRVNILTVEFDAFTDHMSERCAVTRQNSAAAAVVREEWECGETRVLTATVPETPAAREDLRRRCDGQLPFEAGPLPETQTTGGWWGLRRLWRTFFQPPPTDKRERPHAIILGPAVPDTAADWVRTVADRHAIPTFHLKAGAQWSVEAIAKSVKWHLVQSVIDDHPLDGRGYEIGHALGKRLARETSQERLDRAETDAYWAARRQAEADRSASRAAASQRSGAWDAPAATPTENLFPDHLKCPITREPIFDPAITKTGYTYERTAIESHVQEHHRDFVTQEPLEAADIRPNPVVRSFLQWICDNSLQPAPEQQPPFLRLTYQDKPIPLDRRPDSVSDAAPSPPPHR
jgi:hypothetical protein